MDEHREMLIKYCSRLAGGDRHLAEDVVQETFIRAWQQVERLTEERGSVRGWLKQVAHNIAIDHHRAAKRRPREAGLDIASDPPLADDAPNVLDRIVVDSALRTLPAEHRTALVETFLRDRTAVQAARVLGIPAGTVKSRVFYGLRRLRDALEPVAPRT
ncbi:sigma-70 family RNA polymerase sigma factor [Micromonospora craniellae]|uniref:Sigma-70 family RNA polymerase sigma factor n=1 Tax=Micromonospora craniellae TaxID=2294034 RepID=A0A372FXW0_9ACTN|nr:sigma-70 family RNA polymerase sigma factor [Micromonospora craniellae]